MAPGADEHDYNSSLGILSQVSRSLGTSDAVICLLLSLLAGYPLALVHRAFLHGKTASLQHLYFIICGLSLCYINFGEEVLHSIVNVVLIYAVLVACGGTALSVMLAFIINLAYLCIGYYYTMSDIYTIRWTTPHCVLTLRLIGLVWDVYDGHRKPDQITPEQRETALRTVPSLLEVAGHTYFFGGFLVGPQFAMKRYQNFIQGAFTDKVTDKASPAHPPNCVTPAVTRLCAGVLYTGVFQISALFLPDTFLLSQSFQEMPFWMKCLIIIVWGKFILYKYVGVWLITEGACILTGLTYNGKDENGNELWDGCANIRIRQFEVAATCHDLIQSFNINTNKWMAKYIFKRLKFLGSKEISQTATLFFLALWHGLHSGYFSNFFMEFFVMKFERDVSRLLSGSSVVRLVSSLPGGPLLLWLLSKTYAQFALSYSLVSFCLFSSEKFMQVYWSVWMVGHVVFIGWLAFYPLLQRTLLQSWKLDSKAAKKVN